MTCFLALLILALPLSLVLSIPSCPDRPLEELLADPLGLASRLGDTFDWKMSVPEYRTTQRHGLEALANLGRAWTDGGGVTANPQITQHLSQYATPWRAWVQSQLVRRTSSRPRLALESVFPNPQVRERLPSSAYVECGQGDAETCQGPIYHSQRGQYLLTVSMMASEGGVHPEVFGDAVLPFEEHLSARLQDCR